MGDGILDFDEQIAQEIPTAAPPIAFRFHGEIFKAHGDGPGLVLLDFIKASIDDDGLAAVESMLNFLEACMPAEEFVRFRVVCNDPAIVTPVDHLGIIVKGLLSAYNDRPTQPSSPSSDGSSSTGTGSTDGSPATADAQFVG